MQILDHRSWQEDPWGYLINRDDWNESVAKQLANAEGLVLSDLHWGVFSFLREFFQNYGVLPTVRLLVEKMKERFPDYNVDSFCLHNLFPKGVLRQAARLAGLPRPNRCL